MSIDGSWYVTIQLPAGVREAELRVSTEADHLTGALVDANGPTNVEGTVDGDEIEFIAATPGMSGPLVMSFFGRVDDDAIDGGIDLGDAGTGTWSAVRRPERA